MCGNFQQTQKPENSKTGGHVVSGPLLEGL